MRLKAICFSLGLMLISARAAVGAGPPYFEGFENPATLNLPNWNRNIASVPSGTGGITSSSGGSHAQLGVGGAVPPFDDAAAFTRFNGYTSTFGAGFVASLDVYLDPTWGDGLGFDYSVAVSDQADIPDYVDEFIWNVGVVAGDLFVKGASVTSGQFDATKFQSGDLYTVATAGWYTFEHLLYNDGGTLSVDFNLYDSSGSKLYTTTDFYDPVGDGDPPLDIATSVGGNRYGWFTYNGVDGLAIDNSSLHFIGDMNGDGLVDFDDVNPFVLALTDPTAFENEALANEYGHRARARGNITGGGFDFDDVNPFINYLAGGGSQFAGFTAVPEPGSVGLFALGSLGLAVLGRRRRRRI